MIAAARHPRRIAFLAVLGLACAGITSAQESKRAGPAVPQPLEPLEYLVGRWKGQGVPRDDPALRFRGWTETHSWAWVFAKGEPVGLTLEISGGKQFTRGKLEFDPAKGHYRLEATLPGVPGRHVVYTGRLDASGKRLVLESSDGAAPERITLRANSNFLRYTLTFERREPGASGFAPRSEVGLTKEGESFAAGSSAAERPRCVVTGGAATLTVSYRGQSYPICCTGCRDEFNENPGKYLSKLAQRMSTTAGPKGAAGPASKVSRFEDAFAGDVPEEKRSMPRIDSKPPSARDSATASPPAERTKAKPTSRAATALRLAQNLEKSGKRDAAFRSYRQLVKDFPGTEEARTAAARIRSLESP